MQANHQAVNRLRGLWVAIASLALTTAHVAIAADPTLLRAALIVRDASASIDFYRLLGFTIESDATTPRNPKENPFPLNAPSTQIGRAHV